MTPLQRDIMLVAGVVCLVAAGYLLHPVVALIVLGMALIYGALALAPDPPKEGSNDGG